MSWAIEHIAKLRNNETVQFRPVGKSMTGLIESGQLVTVEPISDKSLLKIDSIVLCHVGRNVYVHKIVDISKNETYQIGNNKGHINGWCKLSDIYGIVTKVED